MTEQSAAPQTLESPAKTDKAVLQMPGIRPSKKQRDAMAAEGKPYVDNDHAMGRTAPDTAKNGATDDAQKVAQKKPDDGKADPGTPEKEKEIGQSETIESGDDGKPKGATLKDLAARLEIDPKELYATEIPLGGNDSITLGELKDAYRELEPLRERLTQVDRLEVENRVERSTMIRELDNIVKHLPPQALSPEYQQAVKQQMGVIAQQETQKLLQIFPEWVEPVRYQAAVDGMVSTAKNYGLTPTEVGNIVDHRWIQALHDLSIYKAKESAASKLLKDTQHLGKSPSKTATTATSEKVTGSRSAKNANGNDKAAQAAKIAKLLS